MNDDIKLFFDSSIEHIENINESFSSGVMRICYSGKNRNNSCLSKEAIERAKPTMFNCPIVCNYSIEDDSIGGHDIELHCDDNGELSIVNLTDAIGVVPSGANTWWEQIDDKGITHDYFSTEIILWKRSPAYNKIVNSKITSQSMEISVKDGRMEDGTFKIDNFTFTAFCLLGDDVEPCFESASLQLFDRNQSEQQFALMMQDLKETFTMVNTSKEDDSTHPQNYSMEGGEKVLEDKMKLVAKYGIDVDKLDFSIDDFTVEELIEKFKSMKNDGENDKTDGKFALTSNMVEEINRVLVTEKVTSDWGECPRYCYVDCDIEDGEVYCWDRNDWLLYGFTFSVDGDSIRIDFESKKRKKYVIADFEGDEQASPIAPVFELMESKLKDYAEIETKFNAASDTLTSMKAELDELRRFKTDTENAVAMNERKSECEKVFAKFEDLVGIEAYEALKDDCLKYDLETLEEKCFAIRGRNGAALKFSDKEKTPRLRVPKTDISNEPYGGLFMKYANTGSN